MLPDSVIDGSSPNSVRRQLLSDLGAVAVVFIASRVFIFAVALLSRLQLRSGPFWEAGGLLSVLTRGDAAVYLELARTGSWIALVNQEPSLAFPVFPALVKIAALICGDVAVAGVLVANLSLFAAGVLLHRLVTLDQNDPRISRYAVLLMMFSPASFFYSSAVADSTVLMLAIATILAARRAHWGIATLLGIGTMATGSYGVWVIVPLVVEYIRRREKGTPVNSAAIAVSLLLATAVSLFVLGYSQLGDPLALFRAGQRWERGFASLLQISQTFAGYRIFYTWLFWLSVAAASALCVGGWYLRVRRSYIFFGAALIVACLWSYDLQAARTLGLAFPLFVIMARIAVRYEPAYEAMLTCSAAVLALCTIVAANGFWIR